MSHNFFLDLIFKLQSRPSIERNICYKLDRNRLLRRERERERFNWNIFNLILHSPQKLRSIAIHLYLFRKVFDKFMNYWLFLWLKFNFIFGRNLITDNIIVLLFIWFSFRFDLIIGLFLIFKIKANELMRNKWLYVRIFKLFSPKTID